ncbi:MAG: calcium-translocating P-type ATPase, PMCA-type [Jaaginema sp. PMC 1079.18]|nr:calcium-translocating P-type ATPase, PMCA-type [Jaaginema sp. PMC 1079.18]MEC4868034.1 calcium-translocating P-type ATPase, PMCA-type [Jaaginema sp. PMC 1078.18]
MLSFSASDRETNYRGLTAEEVAASRQKYGENVISSRETQPWWQLYLEKFEDPIIRILTIAAGIAIAVGVTRGDYVESLGIIAAILLATTLAFINEYKADREFEILNQVYDDEMVRVLREGAWKMIPRREVVVGDLVYIEQGQEIPADGEILEAVSLLIDQAKITGESEPVQKFSLGDPNASSQQEETYPVYNLYRSTLVDQGHGLLRIEAVGDRTEIGKIADAIATIESNKDTPLNQQLEKLSQLIGVVGLSVAVLIFGALLIRDFLTGEIAITPAQNYVLFAILFASIIALIPVWLPVAYDGLQLAGKPTEPPEWLESNWIWLQMAGIAGVFLFLAWGLGAIAHFLPQEGTPWLDRTVGTALLQYFMVAVTIIVVAVPEGLAMSVTLSLAYSVRKMAASNNLVRQMHACETIGAATVICADKTGTLTQNKMRVQEVGFPGLQSHKVAEVKFAQNLIAEAIASNSTAELEYFPDQPPQVIGNPTEGSLLLWLDEQNLDYQTYRDRFQFQFQSSFSTEKKYMTTLGISAVTAKDIIHVKGAPEVVLNYCSHILTEYGEFPLAHSEPILKALQQYQERGMRTLGFAYSNLSHNLIDDTENSGLQHLTWLGFVAISDPLRKEVKNAIASCLQAGINLKMVTGDCAATALEIARQIGLWTENDPHPAYTHLSGSEFREMPDPVALEAVKHLKVLSRAIPLDKLRLVQLLQNQGEVVGLTGDGTNDAAALKQARVGLAMGSGTAIAKEASDIILLDDSFQSIVNAIIWGRSLYQNIQRFILFQLTINVVALGIALLGPFIGISLPLTVPQMLWVNLIMDTFAALALAAEPPHDDVLQQPPRPTNAFIISQGMMRNILSVGLIFLSFLTGFLLYLQQDGMTPRELSIFFAVFVFLQFWNLFNARCLGLTQSAFKGLWQNWGFIAIASAIFLGQILIIQYGGTVFRTVPLSLTDWLIIISSTSIVLWVGEIWRLYLGSSFGQSAIGNRQ